MTESSNNNIEQWIRVRVLDSGAFGTVELWNNKTTSEKIAIKKCQIRIDNLTPRQRERWNHEISIMNLLNHPNIVSTRDTPNQIIQVGNGLPVLCMEYCSKGDLRNVLNKCENICGVEEQEALRIMHDVASAVEYLHSFKITHRDLKPGNIVMQPTKDRIIYKLTDLGYAKELGDASVSASIVGTLNYLAPELLWKETYSCSVDYWSLGILFYEIITGTRPFLPNMQITKIWMNHVKGKKYEHVSAREINGQVHFFNNIEDPIHLPDCLKPDLVEWFRVIFQWDPQKRGKLRDEYGSNQLVIFTMLKSIFDKKIIHTFIVPHIKFISYAVNSCITVGELKQLIYQRENICQHQQILTNTTGKILNDQETLTVKMLQNNMIIVFHREQLTINTVPTLKILPCIQEMMRQPRKDYDYYTLKRYYGATIYFMKNEIELYRSYILALSIMIDLCDTKLKNLSVNIKKLNSDKDCLITELKSTSELLENCTIKKYRHDLKKISTRKKIDRFFDGMKQMTEKFNKLIENNEKLKNFSNVDWMNEISVPYDKAVNLLNEWYMDNNNRRGIPCAMVKLLFEFLAIRDKKLSDTQLEETGRNITQFQRKLIQSETVLKSFMELFEIYRKDIKNWHDEIIKKCQPVTQENQLNNTHQVDTNTTEIDNSVSIAPNDSVMYESIVLCNMLGSLLVDMEVWTRKLAALSNSDN